MQVAPYGFHQARAKGRPEKTSVAEARVVSLLSDWLVVTAQWSIDVILEAALSSLNWLVASPSLGQDGPGLEGEILSLNLILNTVFYFTDLRSIPLQLPLDHPRHRTLPHTLSST